MDLLSETVKRCILETAEVNLISLREGAMEICTKEVWPHAVLIGRTERQQTYIECLGPEKLKWPWTFNCLLPQLFRGQSIRFNWDPASGRWDLSSGLVELRISWSGYLSYPGKKRLGPESDSNKMSSKLAMIVIKTSCDCQL